MFKFLKKEVLAFVATFLGFQFVCECGQTCLVAFRVTCSRRLVPIQVGCEGCFSCVSLLSVVSFVVVAILSPLFPCFPSIWPK